VNKREEIIWGGIVLALLYLTGIITFAAHALRVDEIYQPACTEIHKADSSPRGCDEDVFHRRY